MPFARKNEIPVPSLGRRLMHVDALAPHAPLLILISPRRPLPGCRRWRSQYCASGPREPPATHDAHETPPPRAEAKLDIYACANAGCARPRSRPSSLACYIRLISFRRL